MRFSDEHPLQNLETHDRLVDKVFARELDIELLDLVYDILVAETVIGHPVGNECEKDNGCTPHVALLVVLLVNHLWSYVVRRAKLLRQKLVLFAQSR